MAVDAQTDVLDLITAGLRVTVIDADATSTVALEGEWDLAQQDKMRRSIEHVLGRQAERVVLDLSRLTFMDSAGLHGVAELAQHSARRGIGLVVIPGPPAVHRLFEICPVFPPVTFLGPA